MKSGERGSWIGELSISSFNPTVDKWASIEEHVDEEMHEQRHIAESVVALLRVSVKDDGNDSKSIISDMDSVSEVNSSSLTWSQYSKFSAI
jgi:hypothetical protein